MAATAAAAAAAAAGGAAGGRAGAAGGVGRGRVRAGASPAIARAAASVGGGCRRRGALRASWRAAPRTAATGGAGEAPTDVEVAAELSTVEPPASLRLQVDADGVTAERSADGDGIVLYQPQAAERLEAVVVEHEVSAAKEAESEHDGGSGGSFQLFAATGGGRAAAQDVQATDPASAPGLVSSPQGVQFTPSVYYTESTGGARCSLYNEPGEAWTLVTAEGIDRKGMLVDIVNVFDEGSGAARLNISRAYTEDANWQGLSRLRFFVQQMGRRPGEYGQLPRSSFEQLASKVCEQIRGDRQMMEQAGWPAGEEALATFSIAMPIGELFKGWRPDDGDHHEMPVRGVKKVTLDSGVRLPGREPRVLTAQLVPAGEAGDRVAHVLVECPDTAGVFLRSLNTLTTGLDLHIQRCNLLTVKGTAIGSYTVRGLDWSDFYYARELILRSLAAHARGQRELSSLLPGLVEENAGVARIAAPDVPKEDKAPRKGLIRGLRAGVDSRLEKDPKFLFKVGTEICLDEVTTILTNIAVRGSMLTWAMTDWVQVLCHMVQAALNDFMLVYFLAPGGAKDNADKAERKCAHVFEPGDYTLADRAACFFGKVKLYGAIGAVNCVLSRAIVAACICSWETFTLGYMARAAAAGFVHMAFSSNTRYNLVNGLEMLLYRNFREKVAQSASVALRWSNMFLGSRIWLFIASSFAL